MHLQGSPIVTVFRQLDSQVTRGEVRTCGRSLLVGAPGKGHSLGSAVVVGKLMTVEMSRHHLP